MTDTERERLFKAWAESMSRATPELDPGVRQRVLAAHAKSAKPSALPMPYRWALGGLVLAAALAVMLLWRTPAAPSFQVAGRPAAVGAWLTAQPTQALPVRFSEGTLVALGQGSRGRITQVARGGAHIELAHGSVDAEVAHLPGASWTFSAGPFDVAVTGTHLDVTWAPETGKFELSVSRGSVVVQGPFIQGPQEVRAGQVCRVDLTRRLMELGQLSAQHAQRSPPAADVTPSPQAVPPAAPVESAAPQPLGGPGSAHAVSAESWLEAARVARLAGRPAEERAALLACRKRAPGQPPAAQAAYLLGRASAAAEAAQWFEIYLREQPQGLLAREASGRLIESYRAAGNTGAAQTAASRYLALYPNGPHASLARQALMPRSESKD